MKYTYAFPDGQKVEMSGLSRCLCSGCRERFNSVTAFDKHKKNLECLEPSSIGMSKNADNYWITEPYEAD
jgi:hypothetical protein